MKKIGAVALYLGLAGAVSTSVFFYLSAVESQKDTESARKELDSAKRTLASQRSHSNQLQARANLADQNSANATKEAEMQMADARDLVKTAEEAAGAGQERTADAESKLAGANKQMEVLKKEISEHKDAVNNLMAERKMLEAKVKDLSDQLAKERLNDKQDLIDDLRDAQLELSKTRKDKQAADEELKRAMKKIGGLEETVVTIQAQVESQKIQLQDKANEPSLIKMSAGDQKLVESLRSEIKTLRNKLGLPPVNTAAASADPDLPQPSGKIPLAGRIKPPKNDNQEQPASKP